MNLGGYFNLVSDLLFARRLGVKLNISRALIVKPVFWFPPNPGEIKLNIDGAAQGSSGNAINCRSFVKGCFSLHLPICFSFEAKLHKITLRLNFT